jgi:hypothetical protein
MENGTQLRRDEDEDGDGRKRKAVWSAPKLRRELGVGGFAGSVEDERGSWLSVHLYNAQVSPFLIVFMDLLKKVPSLWNAAILLMIYHVNSATSIPTPSFSELGQVFLALLP